MEYKKLRKKNREVLVEQTFNVFYPAEEINNTIKEQWVKHLLECNDVEYFIEQLKKGNIDSVAKVEAEATADGSPGGVKVVDENLEFHAGLKRKLQVTVSNSNTETYQTTPEEPLFLAYHWYRSNSEVYDYDGVRTPLENPVKQGDSLVMPINITPPAEPGSYQLMVTMVYEGRHWMEEVGLKVQMLPVVVQDYDGRGLSRQALAVFKQLQTAELERVH